MRRRVNKRDERGRRASVEEQTCIRADSTMGAVSMETRSEGE